MDITNINKIAFKAHSELPQTLNKLLLERFVKYLPNDNIKRTHLFNNRYENIYLNEKHIPELSSVIRCAITFAETILGIKHLRAGYWFNHMPPNAITTLHTHDDADELLSAVYYIAAPEDSGNLIIYDDSENAIDKKITIKAEAGKFIFFKPNVRHEVSTNNSDKHRLSIGMNFGLEK